MRRLFFRRCCFVYGGLDRRHQLSLLLPVDVAIDRQQQLPFLQVEEPLLGAKRWRGVVVVVAPVVRDGFLLPNGPREPAPVDRKGRFRTVAILVVVVPARWRRGGPLLPPLLVLVVVLVVVDLGLRGEGSPVFSANVVVPIVLLFFGG